MLNHSKSKCASSSHRILMDNAKNRLNDLQERFSDIQAARKEGRIGDLAVLEEQVYQSIREWQAELNAPSPASSFPAGSIGSFSDEIARLLQLYDEEDDATSALKESPAMKPEALNKILGPTESLVLKPEAFTRYVCSSEQVESKPEPFNQHHFHVSISTAQEGFPMDTRPQHNEFPGFHQCNSISDLDNLPISNLDVTAQLDYHLLNMHQELNRGLLIKSDGINECVKDTDHSIQQNICLPPSAFLGPKCALWDCTRPAQGSEWYQSYCSSFHANLAPNENSPGMSPIVRPGGISLKDNLLLDALRSKTQGKNVGIPECEGAVSTKCPWNATELFNLSLVEGETVREWLFFDKPRRAFESGNRKQRSLPDYNGRGWHESRKQLMKEWGGHKRSYYMDPQPPGPFEWHLFEYQINECADCALYRLELKLTNGKKSPKGKAAKDPLVDLQKKMGRLTAEVSPDKPPLNVKGDTKAGSTSQQVNFHDSKVDVNPVHDSGSSAANQLLGQPSQIR